MAIYLIDFKNYEGEDTFELYRGRGNAIERFKSLRKKAKKKEEFCDEVNFNEERKYNEFSFFDPNYNEYSTYITFRTYDSLNELFED